MLTANARKIQKSALLNKLYFDYIFRRYDSLCVEGLILRSKINVYFTKTCYLKNKAEYTYINMQKFIMSQVRLVSYNTFI